MGVLVIQQPNTKTGYLDSANPTLTAGTSTIGYAGNEKAGAYKAIIEWDLRGLRNIRVTAAKLEMYCAATSGGGSGTDRVRRLRRNSASATPFVENDVCWNYYSGTTAWGTAGATNTTSDVDTTDSFSWTAAAGWITACDFSNTALTNLVNDALANQGGYLALLFELASRSGFFRLDYRNGNDVWANTHPKLTLVYNGLNDDPIWTPGGMVVV